MNTKIIEVTNNEQNWGKFLIGILYEEWTRVSEIDPGRPLLRAIGFSDRQILVMDLQTCEGAFFAVGGNARADLHEHRIWVCPLFEPFLVWLYQYYKDGNNFYSLPTILNLPDAPFAMYGYRREGR